MIIISFLINGHWGQWQIQLSNATLLLTNYTLPPTFLGVYPKKGRA